MVKADNPIKRIEDDLLGRANFAKIFAHQVLGLDTSEGTVVGVLGAWGSGKSSFVNLARVEFEERGIPVLDFNPWMFSGTEQLVDSFFIEVAAQLKMHGGLDKIGESLAAYGEAFSGLDLLPVVGPWIGQVRGLAKLVGSILKRREEGAVSQRNKLTEALSKLGAPILVVIDDIDRLTTSEIRDVFKLVRLTASFPNIVYIVAFDRARVEEALGEQQIPGRDYLEKILQLAVDLPEVPDQVLTHQIAAAIADSLRNVVDPGTFDENVWPDILMEVIRPLFRNMRDVRRYAVAIHGTVVSLGGRIALTDVLALEAIRVFLPDVFAALHRSVDLLTSTPDVGGGRDHLKVQADALVGIAKDHDQVVRAMIRRLFPGAQRHIGGSHYDSEWKPRWLKDRRVAHEDILRFYLERVAGEGLLAIVNAERAWEQMADAEAFDQFLRSLELDARQNAIDALLAWEGQFEPKHVVPGTTVLFNMLADFSDRGRNMYELDGQTVVRRATYRLLRSLKDPKSVQGAVEEILLGLHSLAAKLELINQVGYREGVGHKLVPEAVAATLEKNWRDEVRSASTDDLAAQPDLAYVLRTVKRDSNPAEADFDIPIRPDITLAVLGSALSYARSQTIGNRAVRESARLQWGSLVDLYGSEGKLRSCIEELKQTGNDGNKDLLSLADRYLRGDPPKDFED